MKRTIPCNKHPFYFALTALMSFGLVLANPAFGQDFSVIIQISGNQTEICEGNSLILTGQGFYGDENIVRQQWISASDIFEKTQDQFATLKTNIPGKHLITYRAWDDSGQQAELSVTITIWAKPQSEVKISKGFMTRLLGRDFPVKLESTAHQANDTFQWVYNHQNIEGANQAAFIARQSGRYRLITTSEQGCRTYSKAIDF